MKGYKMHPKYGIIEQYRVSIDETWQVFGDRIGNEMKMSWITLYKVVMGKSNPNARTCKKIDDWLQEHYPEMFNTISKSISGQVIK